MSSYAQGWEWTRTAGGNSDDDGKGVCVDPSGNVIQYGVFLGTAYFQGTPLNSISSGYNWFLSKYDTDGSLQWVVNGLSSSNGFKGITAVTSDPDGNIYTTGYFSDSAMIGGTTVYSTGYEDFFIAKFSYTGALQWIRTGGGAYDDKAYDIVCDDAGKVYVAGEYQNNATFGTVVLNAPLSYPNIFGMVLCYNNNGDIQYGKSYGDNGYNKVTGIDYLCLNLYLSGYLDISSGGMDIFAEKTDMSCNTIWAHRNEFNDDGNWSVTRNIHITANPGGVFIAGHFSDSVDFGVGNLYGDNVSAFACGIDLSGFTMWSMKIDSKVATVDAIETAGFEVVLAGTFLDTLNVQGTDYIGTFSGATVLDNNGFVLSLNANGSFSWIKTIEPYTDLIRIGSVDMGGIASNATEVFVSASFTDTINMWPWYPVSFEEMDRDGLLAKIDLEASGVEESINPVINVYPNPSSDLVYIETETATDFAVSIRNINGQLLFTEHFSNTNYGVIRVCGFEKGLYIIEVQSGNDLTIQKMIIQ